MKSKYRRRGIIYQDEKIAAIHRDEDTGLIHPQERRHIVRFANIDKHFPMQLSSSYKRNLKYKMVQSLLANRKFYSLT